ncbi:helix-turn-helix domain-containing protein [Sediminibacterium sp.]|uniref:helix-turn-helix domain-containing protein n=1 Tax=Sediminibacterium sp. TaxID=1917865 RepID=UPI003F6A36B0
MEFSTMVDTPQSIIITKTAIVLNSMLDEAKKKGSSHSRISNNPNHIINSIGKIALETGLRKNTVSDLLNGKKGTKLTTLIPILMALDKTIADFGKLFEKITDSDIQSFKEQHKLLGSSAKIPIKKPKK